MRPISHSKNPIWPKKSKMAAHFFAKSLYIDNKIKNNTFKYMKAMKTTSFGKTMQ